MEEHLVPPHGYPFERVEFSGVRGKGLTTLLALPTRMVRACTQSTAVIKRVQPDVVVGLGGYITVPGGMMARMQGKPLVLHEQNAVAGMANRLLSRIATRTFTAFPGALPQAKDQPSGDIRCIGNPLRTAFTNVTPPQQRFAKRAGVLRLLVVGGSLGAQALNEMLPQALALIPENKRPSVIHQSGAQHLKSLNDAYAAAKVKATTVEFINDMARAYAEADIVICRAGACTVSEIAAVGAAALFVPYPLAVDDHQTANARYLAGSDAAWILQQSELTPQRLVNWLGSLTRAELLVRASKARELRQLDAAAQIANACESLVKNPAPAKLPPPESLPSSNNNDQSTSKGQKS
jgi:UDP-N-acetylglucosamine--N-acetylmuramyl-(pentapeptide) pyrophosphoryl-undecaprenol N-acetylglucosamine transferase